MKPIILYKLRNLFDEQDMFFSLNYTFLSRFERNLFIHGGIFKEII